MIDRVQERMIGLTELRIASAEKFIFGSFCGAPDELAKATSQPSRKEELTQTDVDNSLP